MSSPTDSPPTENLLPEGIKTFQITSEALDTMVRQFKHTAQVGEVFGYDSPTYLVEIGSLHACLAKVFRKDFGVTARITRATYRSDELSLDVVEASSFTFGMIFFPNWAKARNDVVPGEYSMHS